MFNVKLVLMTPSSIHFTNLKHAPKITSMFTFNEFENFNEITS